jgi:hypothetical protein
VKVGLNSPLSGPVNSGFGGVRKMKNKILFGVVTIAVVPFLLSTFAANVTVGNGPLEFGQGSEQAVACDPQVFVALAEEWHNQPTATDASAGFFRVKSVTVSNLDLTQCHGKHLRVRLLDQQGQEIQIGGIAGATVLQATLPDESNPSNITDPVALHLSYLDTNGNLLSGVMNAQIAVNVSGTSVYDGSVLSPTNADVTFFLDPTSQVVNIDAGTVGRTTVETLDNPGGN